MQQTQPDRQWFIVERWNEYDSEIRANVIRVLAVFVFYAIHLFNYHFLQATTAQYHRMATFVALGWTVLATVALVAVRGRFLPWWLKYATTALDIVLLTILLVGGVGPQSPLVVGYFVVLAVAALRLQLPLIRVATCAVVGSYLFVLAACHPDWFGTFGSASRDFRVPRHEQLITIAALVTTGIVLGQSARRVRRLAQEYQQRIHRHAGQPARPAHRGVALEKDGTT